MARSENEGDPNLSGSSRPCPAGDMATGRAMYSADSGGAAAVTSHGTDGIARKLESISTDIANLTHLREMVEALSEVATRMGAQTLEYRLSVVSNLVELAQTVARDQIADIKPVKVVSLVLCDAVPEPVPGLLGQWLKHTCGRLQAQLIDRLALSGWVAVRPVVGESFDPAVHQCTGHVAVSDPALNGRIAEVESMGLHISGKLEVPASVKIGAIES